MEQKIWHVCNNCDEWFHFNSADALKTCPDCGDGELQKGCYECQDTQENCVCSNSLDALKKNNSKKTLYY